MPVTGTAMANALNALRLYSRKVDEAASRIASVGLFAAPTETAPDSSSSPAPADLPAESVDLGEAMVDIMVAQRAFVAQLRVLRTSDEMIKDTVYLRKTDQE